MITEPFDFIAIILAFIGFVVWLEKTYFRKFFSIFPAIVVILFGSMVLYTLGLWELNEGIREARTSLRDSLIPAMLFLMSLTFDFGLLRSLGWRLIALNLGAIASVAVSFIVGYSLMHPLLGSDAGRSFGVMAAGWTGGTQNFVAVKEALDVSDEAMTYTLLMGAFCYSCWLILILSLESVQEKCNWLLETTDLGFENVPNFKNSIPLQVGFDKESLMMPLGLSMFVASLSNNLASFFASFGLFTPMIWVVILSSCSGIAGSFSPLRNILGIEHISGIMLYIIVALIAAEVSLAALINAPIYIVTGFLILFVHAVILLIIARILRVNILMAGLASIASIGSAPSAAVVGAAYGNGYAQVGIIMALLGSILGTLVGFTVGVILS